MISTFWAYRNKITNKLWGVVHIPALGAKKGDVLLSYITSPFTQTPGEFFTDPHSSYWECGEIARLFAERGYAVDIINAQDHTFIPHKAYAVCVDIQRDLERLSNYLPASCKKVVHVENPYYGYYNEVESQRLQALRKRRGITLASKRSVPVTASAAIADFLEGFGNNAVHATFAAFNKPVFRIPISVTKEFDFPAAKDFSVARKHFLWFGGGGAVLKGLDLAIEAFAQMSELTLHIVGPSAYEPEFAKAYEYELSLPNIIRYPRPHLTAGGKITVDGRPFIEVVNQCAALIYPSASEGTSGAVVQAMHAGIIPVVTPQTGLGENAPAVLLPQQPSVEDVTAAVRAIADTEPAELRTRAKSIWDYARAHHTKTTFSTAYAHFIDDTLKV